MSKKFFCLPGQVQWEIGNGSILPVTSLGVAQGVLRVAVGDILLKRRCGFILTALGLHGDDLSTALDKEINFTVFIGVIAGFHIELAAKLLQDIVFRQRTLELIIRLQQNGTVINACHVFEQTGVEHEEFELVQFVKGCQGMLHLGDIVDAVQHSGRDQPLDGLFKVPGPAAFPDSSIHELLVAS